MLKGLARFSYRHRWVTLFIWILLLAGTVLASREFGGNLANNISLPGTETQATFDLLEERMPARAGDVGQIVFLAEDGVAAVQDRMEAGFEAAREVSGQYLIDITSPYSPEGARQVAQSGEFAGRIAYAELQFDRGGQELPAELSDEIQEAVNDAVNPDRTLTVEYGGFVFQEIAPPGGREEKIGLAAAVLILLVSFGSVLAMGLPIFMALFGLGISLTGIGLLARYMEVATFAPLVAAMVGLGVGIDYALFIVTRYRQNLAVGMETEDAVVSALTTAGRAVLFAGVTVIISLMGMFLMGLSLMYGLALGTGLAVLVTMMASVTLLPALLGFVGSRIDKFSVHLRRKSRPAKSHEAAFWYRWSRQVQRHPLAYALLCLLILGTLAAPVFSIRLGNQDAGNGPTELTTRRAYDLLADAFGPGYNGPLLVAAAFDSPADAFPKLQALAAELASDPGVAEVSPPIPNDPDNPTAALIQVIGRYAPQDIRTDQMVTRLREDIIAPAARDEGLEIHSGGMAAIGLDLTDKLTERLPVFFGGVILLSFILLMAAFRSILVPLKAAIMNLLGISAAFGVLVAVFQWGWGADLIGVDRTGPIFAGSPMLLFAILFGLSMDYEVFLLSRIKEEHDRTGNNAQAVADGLASTGRVITAAAAIMVTVFFSFVLGDEPNAKLIGLGLAVAVFLDATVVRMILVPATMELLGEANWYLPRWLDRILPNIHIESESDEVLPMVPSPEDIEADGEPAFPEGAPAGKLPYATVQPRPQEPDLRRYPAYPTAPPATPAADRPGASIPAPNGGRTPSELDTILRNLPFRAGQGDVRSILEEVARATYDHYRYDDTTGEPPLDVSRVSGYLALEQRFGRIAKVSNPEHAAQLLLGAVAAQALAESRGLNGAQNGDPDSYPREAVKILLEGIGRQD